MAFHSWTWTGQWKTGGRRTDLVERCASKCKRAFTTLCIRWRATPRSLRGVTSSPWSTATRVILARTPWTCCTRTTSPQTCCLTTSSRPCTLLSHVRVYLTRRRRWVALSMLFWNYSCTRQLVRTLSIDASPKIDRSPYFSICPFINLLFYPSAHPS